MDKHKKLDCAVEKALDDLNAQIMIWPGSKDAFEAHMSNRFNESYLTEVIDFEWQNKGLTYPFELGGFEKPSHAKKLAESGIVAIIEATPYSIAVSEAGLFVFSGLHYYGIPIKRVYARK